MVVACGSAKEDDTSGADSSSGSESSDGSVDGSTGGDTWLPAACELDSSPFVDSECLGGLRLACNGFATEEACAAAAPLAFDDGGYAVRCGWASVIAYDEASTCAVASMTSRCEAYIDQECFASCTAITSELEIIDLCGGPLGPWSAVDIEDDGVGTCAPNTQPPAPALCDCAPATCAVE